VPVAVLTAIVVPMVLLPQDEFAVTPTNPYLVAGIFSVAIAGIKKNLTLTIVSGLLVFFLMRFFMS